MPKILVMMLIICFGQTLAGQIEFKYNIVGPVVPNYSEHGVEVEYSQNEILIPFMRIALLDRDYENKTWEGETVGRNIETGFQIWVGNKAKPFTWGFTRNLELLLFYRQSQTEFEHISLGWATGGRKESVGAKAIGAGLSFNVSLGKWVVVEPFWYGDYGRYEIEKRSGNTTPHSPYFHRWDDEHRVGLNVGLKL
jgi:hypothetical protein